MALKLPVEHESGTVAEYWRIEGVSLNIAVLSTEITMALYLNETARRTGKRPIFRMPIEVPAVDLINEDKKNVVAKTYELIKKIPKWAASEDV